MTKWNELSTKVSVAECVGQKNMSIPYHTLPHATQFLDCGRLWARLGSQRRVGLALGCTEAEN